MDGVIAVANIKLSPSFVSDIAGCSPVLTVYCSVSEKVRPLSILQ